MLNGSLILELMQDFRDVTDSECIYIENSTTARVMSKGKILLKFTSSKLLSLRINKLPSLSNVLYVPSFHRNLVSGILVKKAGLKIIVGDDKVIISHYGVFVGKVYLNGSLFNLVSETMGGNASSSAYIAKSVDLRHGRPSHVNFTSIKRFKNMC